MLYDELLQLASNLKAVSFFSENSLTNEELAESLTLKIADIRSKSDDLFELLKNNEKKIIFFEKLLNPSKNYSSDDYLAGSKISAVNKGIEVVRKIKDQDIEITNYGFISLGGGDGTELYAVLENSNIDYGLLLEYDFKSVNRFVENNIPFQLKHYSRSKLKLDVMECDLFDDNKLKLVKDIIKDKNLDGIVISIHAVLHELSTRSQLKSNYLKENGSIDLEEFFMELYEWHKNIIIFIREPGEPENWPANVHISIAEQYQKDFLTILDDIDRSHFEGNKKSNFNFREDQNHIWCNSNLAIEALTKLFYQVDYEYEKREKITSVSRKAIVKALQGGGRLFTIIECEPFFTNSLIENFNKFQVKITGEENMVLSKPQCFSYTVASKGNFKKLK